MSGTIQRLNPRGFGFIACEDGVERFFSAREVRNISFNELAVGMRVHCKPAAVKRLPLKPEAHTVEAACTL